MQAMSDMVPLLIGTAGMVQGERYTLAEGVPVVIGRSRSCDISLRRLPAYLNAPPEQRDADHDFNTVSRRHARIEVRGGRARIDDLSTNGTFVNGEFVSGSTEVDLSQSACSIRLGSRECFELKLVARDDPALATGGAAARAAPSA